MAAIEKRSGKQGEYYRIRVTLKGSAKGKRQFAEEIFYPTAKTPKGREKQARDRAVLFQKQVNEGKYSFDKGITFADYVDEWYNSWAVKNLTLSQQEAYRSHLKIHVIPVIGRKTLGEIRKRDCKSVIAKMEQEGKASKTIRRIVTAMRSVFKYAEDEELIYTNPCDGLTLPKLKKEDGIHCFDLEQAKRFLNALTLSYPMNVSARKRQKKGSGEVYEVKPYITYKDVPFQFQVYFHLAIKGGFRRGEMIALTWNDVDFENRVITINKAVSVTKAKGQIVGSPKTESSNRQVYVPQDCIDMLEDLLDQQKEECLALGSKWEGMPIKKIMFNNVFTQYNGKMMSLTTPANRFDSIISDYNTMIESQAGQITDPQEKEKKLNERLPKIRLHDLRHTFATLLIAEGTDIVTVSKTMGHASVSVTLDVYSHLLVKPAKAAADTFERIFASENTVSPEMRS